jgi:hypothetical protein
MSISQDFAFSPATNRHGMLSQICVARLITLWGAAGAVLVQTAIFGLVARLALQIDSAVLPGPAVSAVGLALGALAMLASRSLAAHRPLAA